MSSRYDALNARARGLRTHLFTRAELEDLALAGTPEALGRALLRSGRLAPPVPPLATVAAAEAAVRHTAAEQLAVLNRWAERSDEALEVFHAEEERRTLRAMLRGAVEGVPTATRLEGLVPTPGLPEGALQQLSRAATVAAVISGLVVLQRPEVSQLLPLAGHAEPSLFALELALLRAWAGRAVKAARRGDANLRRHVELRVDVLLWELALAAAGGPRDLKAEDCFVSGGRWLKKELFAGAFGSESRATAAEKLWKGLDHTPLAPVARQHLVDPAQLELSALRFFLERQRSQARLDPLSSAPALRTLLLLQVVRTDLLRVAWGAAFGAPASLVRPGMVTPWS